MLTLSILAVALLALVAIAFVCVIRARNLQYWLAAHVVSSAGRLGRRAPSRRHVLFCFADHYEPYGGGADKAGAHARVARWLEEYPKAAQRHRDSFGNFPKHTFFYPVEEYDPELLEQLKTLCVRGIADVEVHLHHDNDSAENLRRTLSAYVSLLHDRHGLLRRDPVSGKVQYLFIHGNWALDNSRPDGRWCGVDNELDVLVETGCCADLTMPSAPSDTQTRKINSIYFARGRPGRRKSHDHGRDVRVGGWAEPGELLLIQGPLTLNWREAKLGILPRIESAELSFDARPSEHRVRLWGKCSIGVRDADEYVFIKVHTHGATDGTMQMLFAEGGFERLWTELEKQYRIDDRKTLRYVTAWEMYGAIRDLALQRAT